MALEGVDGLLTTSGVASMNTIEQLTRVVERLVVEVEEAEDAVAQALLAVDDYEDECDDVKAELAKARQDLLRLVNTPASS